VENGKQLGPFSFEQLKVKSIAKDTLIWFDGLDKWTKAEKIVELSSLLSKMPPPINEVDDRSVEENMPPIPVEVKQAPNNSLTNSLTWLIIAGALYFFYLNDFNFSRVISKISRGANSVFNIGSKDEVPTVDTTLNFEEARNQIVEASEKQQKDKNLELLVAKVDVETDITNDFAAVLASKFPGEYSIPQVCRIYDYIVSQWKYVNDSNKKEIFRSASRSINNGFAGDCDDFAILMAALVESVGGTARISFAYNDKGGHAFAEVYATSDKAKLQEIINEVVSYYESEFGYSDEMIVNYRTDSSGKIWLNMDWFGEPKHLGGDYFDFKKITTYYPTAATPSYE
jgi:hypothetical protein